MAANLFPELLDQIFCHFQNDSSTLFICSLVSRRWCSSAIPWLWKQSFTICKRHQRYKLVKAYLNMLNQDSKLSLINNILTQESRKAIIALDLDLTSRKPLLFDYASLLQQLDYSKILKASKHFWWNQRHNNDLDHGEFLDMTNLSYDTQNNDDVYEYYTFGDFPGAAASYARLFNSSKHIIKTNISTLAHQLWILLMTHSRITCLKIDTLKLYTPRARYSRDIVSLPNFTLNDTYLSSIREFTIGGDFVKDNILEIMSQLSKDIEEINIFSCSTILEDIDWAPLIRAQRNLKSLKLRSIRYDLTSLFTSLSTQTRSLRHVKFDGCTSQKCLPLSILSQCSNLETLILSYCGDYRNKPSLSSISNLSNISNEKISSIAPLKTLQLNSTYLYNSDLISFIIGSNKNLQELILDINLSDYPSLDTIISENCPNLRKLKSNLFGPYILTILKHCHKIEYINIKGAYQRESSLFQTYLEPGQILEQIATTSSEQLKKLVIDISSLFTNDDLSKFFTKCCGSLEYFGGGCYGYREHVEEEIMKYARKWGVGVVGISYESRSFGTIGGSMGGLGGLINAWGNGMGFDGEDGSEFGNDRHEMSVFNLHVKFGGRRMI
ncbi:32835_t:CDS:1 [Gigaspora margarita]|uniref:32835_t:CDS:1 n=1 Tax=Gigaspora margarita TaxID=4874 RepID=A0ABN7UIM5_GIGMA|nr:32835_t:CDS:1 [Gigaspora margarita]